jgi:hypothetical protein
VGFWTFYIVWYATEHDVSELDLFPSSGEGGGEDAYSVGPSSEDGNRSSFRNVVFSRIPNDGKSPKTQ